MTVIGFHCSHEQISPAQLLKDVQQAEQAGFTAGMSSDHFSPWSERQGESGFAWSFLGAALATTNIPFGVVNAPGQRYHPAIIAQAIATLAQMFPGRFWAALGSGEASNERMTGEVWPRKEIRDQRLSNAWMSSGGCCPVRRSATRVSSTSIARGCGRCPTPSPTSSVRPSPRDSGASRRLGGRTGHRQPVQGDAAEGPGLLPRGWRARAGPTTDPPQLGAHRRRSAGHRPRPVAQQRLRPACVLGRRDRRDVRRHQRGRLARPGQEIGAHIQRPRQAHRVVAGVRRPGMGRAVSALRGPETGGLHRSVR